MTAASFASTGLLHFAEQSIWHEHATAATTFLQVAVPGATVEAAPIVSEPELIPETDDSSLVLIVASAGGAVGAVGTCSSSSEMTVSSGLIV